MASIKASAVPLPGENESDTIFGASLYSAKVNFRCCRFGEGLDVANVDAASLFSFFFVLSLFRKNKLRNENGNE